MKDYPCSDNCPTYAMCNLRTNQEKFSSCAIYADYVVQSFEDTQRDLDAEFGKGKTVMVGFAGGDKDYLIDRKGQIITTIESAKKWEEKSGR